ncbi:carboxylic ester hydrolase [Nocardioides szechwanensis]|nr:carboxylic ester hydrolase [Nocardioides szechwanensis]
MLLALGATACTEDEPVRESSPMVVEIADGVLHGTTHDGILSWGGIPYAAPPVGDLRWAEPQPPEPWEGERDATRFGDACLQGPESALGESLIKITEDTDEDCLFLNVHRPLGDVEDLPVMVWIHGGSFLHGAGSQPTYNSPDLVQRGVVLVTINYRLGRLGFFAHPALEGDVANFGLLDQVAALEWVRDNVADFGGDPDNVTIFGESAGGASVNALMASPRTDGLYARAISQSGLGRERSQSLDDARATGEKVAAGWGAKNADAADLRALDAAEVMDTGLNLLRGEVPIVDGGVLPAPVSEVFAAGDEADVPYLVGTTDLEIPDTALVTSGQDPDALRREIAADGYDEAVAAYGGEEEFGLHFFSDVIFTEPARFLATAHAERAPTYLYRFSIAAPAIVDALGGAFHASEIPYVFDATEGQRFSFDESPALADTISDYWVSFATGSDPSHDGAPAWPTAADGTFLELTVDGPVAVTDDPWRARLDAVQKGYESRS